MRSIPVEAKSGCSPGGQRVGYRGKPDRASAHHAEIPPRWWRGAAARVKARARVPPIATSERATRSNSMLPSRLSDHARPTSAASTRRASPRMTSAGAWSDCRLEPTVVESGAIRAKSWRCSRVVGLMAANRVWTGWPSTAPKSTGRSRKQSVTIGWGTWNTIGLRTCGRAIPPPTPVEAAFSREEQTQEQTAIEIGGERQPRHHCFEGPVASRVAKAIEDAAPFQRVAEPGRRFVVVVEPIEQVGAHAHAVGRRPLEEFRAVESILPGDVPGGQAPLANPAGDRRLRDVERLAHVTRTQCIDSSRRDWRFESGISLSELSSRFAHFRSGVEWRPPATPLPPSIA